MGFLVHSVGTNNKSINTSLYIPYQEPEFLNLLKIYYFCLCSILYGPISLQVSFYCMRNVRDLRFNKEGDTLFYQKF